MSGPAEGKAPRNIVICMDGTGNAPKASGNTNVLRLFGMVRQDDPEQQVAFYTPGVGTRGDPAALTGIARLYSKVRGLVTGYGMRRDIADAYTFLVDTYRPGDRVFIFGFSRGAFAALALAGACRLHGLVRVSSRNMVGWVVKAIAKPIRKSAEMSSYKFRGRFSRRSVEREGLPHQWVLPIHFLGLWDTVKALKYFKFITRFKEGWLKRWYHPAWPFTGAPDQVTTVRHAVSIDDRRIPYDVFDLQPSPGTDFEEVWFRGVHSDVGGGFSSDDTLGLGAITLKWMVEAAVASGLLLESGQYADKCTVADPTTGELEVATKVHRNSVFWLLVGLRRRLWRRPFRRRILERPFWRWFSSLPTETISLHQSVTDLGGLAPPRTVQFRTVDPNWTQPRPEGRLNDP